MFRPRPDGLDAARGIACALLIEATVLAPLLLLGFALGIL